jgi:hypothetical protein
VVKRERKKAALAAERSRKPAGRSAKTNQARARVQTSESALVAAYEIPEPRFLAAFWLLSILFLTVAMTPTMILSRVRGDLANRRGGLGFTGLLIAFVPVLLVIGSALSQ